MEVYEGAVIAHLKFGCRNHKVIQFMNNNKFLKHVPSLGDKLFLQWKFLVCAIMKVPRLPSNLETTMLNLEPGQLIFLDFAFMNVVSVRGFQSYLSCNDDTLGYSFTFPTRNKRSPLDLLCFIILTLQTQNKRINYVRFDEGVY